MGPFPPIPKESEIAAFFIWRMEMTSWHKWVTVHTK